MKISTRGEYGLRAILDIALHYKQGPITLKSVAERQGISEPYLEQLISGLKKAGLVSSIRGSQGGYELAREPSQIKIGDIIRVLEGPIAPVDCLLEDLDEKGCCNIQKCATRLLWQKLRDSMIEVLDSTTLMDLVENAKGLDKDGNMYYI